MRREKRKWENAGKGGNGREWLLGRKRWHVAVPVHFCNLPLHKDQDLLYSPLFALPASLFSRQRLSFRSTTPVYSISPNALARPVSYARFCPRTGTWSPAHHATRIHREHSAATKYDILHTDQPARHGRENLASHAPTTHHSSPLHPQPPGSSPFSRRPTGGSVSSDHSSSCVCWHHRHPSARRMSYHSDQEPSMKPLAQVRTLEETDTLSHVTNQNDHVYSCAYYK